MRASAKWWCYVRAFTQIGFFIFEIILSLLMCVMPCTECSLHNRHDIRWPLEKFLFIMFRHSFAVALFLLSLFSFGSSWSVRDGRHRTIRFRFRKEYELLFIYLFIIILDSKSMLYFPIWPCVAVIAAHHFQFASFSLSLCVCRCIHRMRSHSFLSADSSCANFFSFFFFIFFGFISCIFRDLPFCLCSRQAV